MSDATDIAADLRADGQEMTLTRTTYSGGDAAAGDPGAPIVQTWTVYGRDKELGRNTTTIEGTLIITGDRLLLVSADKVISVPGDEITFDDETWSVLSCNKLKGTGAEVVLQKLHVRE